MRESSSGFSLFELLLVLVMLGIVATIATPSVTKLLSGLEFRKQIGEIMAQVRFVRLQAVVSGEQIKMRIQDNELLLSQDAHKLERRDINIDSESRLFLSPDEIIFTPQSTVTPATIHFSLGNRSREIRLDPLTALPVIR